MAEEKRGYTISDIYQGGYSSMSPEKSYGGGYFSAGSLGMTTDPRSANILQEVSTKLASGVKQIEIEAVSPEIFDSIPKQQLKEVNRLTKLTGIDVSLHGPVIDVSGIDPRGGGFSETDRENAERRVADVLLRSHELNPDGNIPVNFHSAEGIPGSQFLPPSERKDGERYKRMIVVNKETGRIAPLESEIEYLPGMKELEKGKYRTAEQTLDKVNTTEWDNSVTQLIFNKQRFDEVINDVKPFLEPLQDPQTGEIKVENQEYLTQKQKEVYKRYLSARDYLDNVYRAINSQFSKAWKFGDEHKKNVLKEISNDFVQKIEKKPKDPFTYSEAMGDFLHDLKSSQVIPQIYVPIEEFAVEKSSKTYGNAAWEAYKKYKDKSPLLTIENPPAGFALSTGEDVKNIVEKSREQFVKNAVTNGLSEDDAKEQAEKLIGATWDVGHINMLRKFGYSEKDIVKETEKIAPLLKHVHLSDNFGFEHTELPMGMGNVPLKEMMEKLGEKGFNARKIIEAASWWQHWKTPPFQESLEAMGSPVYGMKMAPYWSQATGLYQGYFSGFGQMLPQINYETFGTGFSRLPSELGGQIQGAGGSRMSGRQME
ncbi:MAG: TIM barrel protein [Nanoarchaeota archaeon]